MKPKYKLVWGAKKRKTEEKGKRAKKLKRSKDVAKIMAISEARARKVRFVDVLLDRKYYALQFSKDPARAAELEAMRKRLLRMPEVKLRQLEVDMATERLNNRYGRTSLQKRSSRRDDETFIRKADLEDSINETREHAIARTKKLVRRLRRKKKFRPQVYSLAHLQSTVPELKMASASSMDESGTER